ncbi:diguanylate cyclase [Burkholderiales bacterium GJ-E10]|nr:diguanylate cyclase [Burkholderiales bacterium GJ-E10]
MIARLFFDQVRPARVCVFRVLGEPEDRRVQLRICVDATGASFVDPVCDPDRCPPVTERAHWHECVLLGDVVHYLSKPRDGSEEHMNSVFPILAERGLVGLVEIEFSGQRTLQPKDARALQGVLRILRNHLSVLDYGERDTLTGLLNRRNFETSFAKRRTPRRRGTDPQDGTRTNWVGIIDVDHFKSVNDTFGHLFGDEVLLLVARMMQGSFRHTEALYRFGGEEFLVILDGADESGAMIAFERFRNAVASHRFPQIAQVTVSIGITRIEPDDIPATAIDRADSALYYAKQSGRNRTLAHEALLREGLLVKKQVQSPDLELF